MCGIFLFIVKFKKKLLFANSGEPDQTLRFAASDLVLHCLPMSYTKDTRLICVNSLSFSQVMKLSILRIKHNERVVNISVNTRDSWKLTNCNGNMNC